MIVNEPNAIHRVNDKARFRQLIDSKPYCPATYFFKDRIVYPAVLRPDHHAQGEFLYIVKNAKELEECLEELLKAGKTGWYASEIIKKDKEFRVFIVSGRAVWVAEKQVEDKTQFAWNVEKGGKFVNVRFSKWPLKAVKACIDAFLATGLDFGAVDVIVSDKGSPYVLEINSAPTITSPYRQQATAKAFDYVMKNGKELIPLKEERGGYSKFAHPAVLSGKEEPANNG